MSKTYDSYEENKIGNNNLDEQINTYKKKIEELEESKKELSKTKKEYEDRMNKLEIARKQFMDLSKKMEEKKVEFKNRENKISGIEKLLEKERYEIEKEKYEVEKIKKKYENLSLKYKSDEDLIVKNIKEKEEEVKPQGRSEKLKQIFKKLLEDGNFLSTYLIDGKGMLIAEYSKIDQDKIAIGAMFSLINSSVSRAAQNLNLHDVNYLKLASNNGYYIIKNITLQNYKRKFILVIYYSDENNIILEKKKRISRKTIRKILKDVKKELYNFRKSKINNNIAFDLLIDRINLIKKSYELTNTELDDLRNNILTQVANEIRELFES